MASGFPGKDDPRVSAEKLFLTRASLRWIKFVVGIGRSTRALFFGSTAQRELADRAFDMKGQARQLGEQIDIAGADGAAAESHVGSGQIEGLQEDADILQNERVGDR